jgi:hypothetical protein
VESKRREIERKCQMLETQINALRLEFQAHEEELLALSRHKVQREEILARDMSEMTRIRHAGLTAAGNQGERGENDDAPHEKTGRSKTAKARQSGR